MRLKVAGVLQREEGECSGREEEGYYPISRPSGWERVRSLLERSSRKVSFLGWSRESVKKVPLEIQLTG